MSLITTPRQAVEIIAKRIAKEGEAGAIQFARTVLGAHAEQGKRLAVQALQYLAGDLRLEDVPDRDEPEVQVSREVGGKRLNLTLKTDLLPVTTYEELVAFYDIDTEVWRPTKQSFSFWGSDERPNFSVRADFERDDYQHAFQLDREQTRSHFAKLAPEPVVPTAALPAEGERLFELMLADLHAGRTGQDLDYYLGVVRTKVQWLLAWAELHACSRIAIVLNGDTFNDDNSHRTTYSGIPQESEGDWREVFTKTRDLVAELVLEAARLAPTDVYVIEGNHDRERSFYLADSLAGLMAEQERVYVHLDTLRNYIDWGCVTIGLAHGDEMKPLDLALTLLRETDTTDKRVFEWHLGHRHTRVEDELHGVLIRRFRTPTVPDEWHRRKGLSHNVRDVVGIVWDKQRGEVATYRSSFMEGE